MFSGKFHLFLYACCILYLFRDHKVTEGEAFRHIFLDLELWNSKEDIQSFLVDKLGVVFISGHASKENMKLVFKSSKFVL